MPTHSHYQHTLGSLPASKWSLGAFEVLNALQRLASPGEQLAALSLAYWLAKGYSGMSHQEIAGIIDKVLSESMVETHTHLKAVRDYAKEVFG